jgi:FkbM family methyltransferase
VRQICPAEVCGSEICYGWKFRNHLIYDVGLHKGEDSEFYLKKGFRVVAIEALPALAEIAAQRLRAYLDSGQLVILNVAIAENNGPLTFFENPDKSVWGTAYPEWAERYGRLGKTPIETHVQGTNFAEILSQHGIPYYLKVDIEGADILCLEALKRFDAKPKYVSIESSKTSWKSLCGEFALLKTLGFSRFKVVPQHATISQACPFPAREGRYVDHHFEGGASGLFGEETPGEWMCEAAAVRAYRSIFVKYKMFGEDSIARRHALTERFLRRFGPAVRWYDTHATV